MSHKSIAVVIPFYQRQSGILRKAVLSALMQEGASDLVILIVDDASPVSAREDIGDLVAAHPDRIKIIEQANGGPASARNRALDNVPLGTEFVAFLDSDDAWTQDHIANALVVLESGDDFYFADH